MWCASRRPPLGVRLFLSHFAVSRRAKRLFCRFALWREARCKTVAGSDLHICVYMGPPPLLLSRDGSSVSMEVSARRLRVVRPKHGPFPREDVLLHKSLAGEPGSSAAVSVSTDCLVVRLDGDGGATYECRGATRLSAGQLRLRSRGLTLSSSLGAAHAAGPVRVQWSVPPAVRLGASEHLAGAGASGLAPGGAAHRLVRWGRDSPSLLELARRRLGRADAGDALRGLQEGGGFAGTLQASSCSLDLSDGGLVLQDAVGWVSSGRGGASLAGLCGGEVRLRQRAGLDTASGSEPLLLQAPLLGLGLGLGRGAARPRRRSRARQAARRCPPGLGVGVGVGVGVGLEP